MRSTARTSAHGRARSWKLGSEGALKKVEQIYKEAKDNALNRDAMAEPTKMLPMGMWNRSRLRGGRVRDLGNATGDLY
jgi:hypothetical protein